MSFSFFVLFSLFCLVSCFQGEEIVLTFKPVAVFVFELLVMMGSFFQLVEEIFSIIAISSFILFSAHTS